MPSHSALPPSSQMPRALLTSLVVSWVVFFALGIWGHLALHNSFVESVYKSLQLFHLHYHPEAGDAHGGDVPISLQVARFGAGLWALALYPALLAFFFERSLSRWAVKRFWKGHAVVWGHCERTLNLVLDLAREGQRVVYIGQSPIPPAQLPRRVVFIEGSDDRQSLLQQAGLARAARLVALNESDTANLEILVAAERVCSARPARLPPLEGLAHFADTHLQGGLYRTVVTAPSQQASRLRQHLFSYYDIVAGALARGFPLPEATPKGRPLPEHFVIVGFGAFGQCVARKLVKMGLQLYREGDAWKVCKTRITVVDPLGEKATHAFLLSNPLFTDYCDLHVLPIECQDPKFLGLEFLADSPPVRRTSLLICLWDEAVTVRTALLLRDSGRRVKQPLDLIGLRVAQPERLGRVFEHLQDDKLRPKLMLFAPDSEVFTADALLHRSLDVLARQVHGAYLKVEEGDRRANNQPPAAGKTWEELSEDDCEGNREAADHVWARLAALGYELRPVHDAGAAPTPDPALLDDLKRLEEDMARLEHERWMAWRLLTGWQWGAKRDNAAKLHPDIVDYDQLAESTKEKDRIIIRAIPDLLKAGRLRVQRRLPAG